MDKLYSQLTTLSNYAIEVYLLLTIPLFFAIVLTAIVISIVQNIFGIRDVSLVVVAKIIVFFILMYNFYGLFFSYLKETALLAWS